MIKKSDLLRRHIIAPAIDLGDNNIIKGQIGQTHADLISGVSNPPPNIGHGFILNNGQYASREQTRDYLNSQHVIGGHGEGPFTNAEPTSEQLRTSVPIYQTPRQSIYSLGANRAVSVVTNSDNDFDIALLVLHKPQQGPSGGFSIDYSKPPLSHVTSDEVEQFITEASR